METQAFPNFKAWDKYAVKVGRFDVAPEDFFIRYLNDGNEERLFTHPDALDYEGKILIPNGWRLGTSEEWAQIIKDVNHLGGTRGYLRLNTLGFIPWFRTKDDPNLIHDNQHGYYWAKDLSGSNNAYYLKAPHDRIEDRFFIGNKLCLRAIRDHHS